MVQQGLKGIVNCGFSTVGVASEVFALIKGGEVTGLLRQGDGTGIVPRLFPVRSGGFFQDF